MGLNSWWNDDADKANDFLDTGAYNDVVRNAPLNDDTSSDDGNPSQLNECTSSAQCPVGYACVNGRCTYMNTGPTGGFSNGQWNSAGGCNQDDPNSPCNSGGPNSCSQTPNCGDVSNPRLEDCCGERCCSFGSLSSPRPGIHCYCGKCPEIDEKKCSIFCDGYTAANGESVMGCNEGNSCNECQECDFLSDRCENKDNAPCWCEGQGCSDCRKCDTTIGSNTLGQCGAAAPGACSICSHIDAYQCPCGETVGPITACSKYDPINGSGYGGNVILSNKSALQLAKEQCRPASSCDDRCKGDCVSKTYCDGAPPACPPGINCTVTGTLSAGGSTCTFRTECDMSNVPEDCKDCDCNCHDDCTECEICGADGVCQPDPECGEDRRTVWVRDAFFTSYQACGGGNCNVTTVDASYSEQQWTSGCGPLPHTLELTLTPELTPGEPGVSCDFIQSVAAFTIRDANGASLGSFTSNGTVTGSICLVSGGAGGIPYQTEILDCP